jgi:hypothetical protein
MRLNDRLGRVGDEENELVVLKKQVERKKIG